MRSFSCSTVRSRPRTSASHESCPLLNSRTSASAATDAIRAIGGFRRLRTDGTRWAIPYREDTDFGLRLVRDAGPVPFEPDAFVLHPAESVDLRRLVRLARYYVVDAAFTRLHPESVPRLRTRPLARLRIRLATAITLLAPLLLGRRTRPAAALGMLALASAVSAQFEAELRSAGIGRELALAGTDTLRRLPRSLLWSLVAGSARLQGESMVALGLAQIPPGRPEPLPAPR